MAREVQACIEMMRPLVPGFEPRSLESLEEVQVGIAWTEEERAIADEFLVDAKSVQRPGIEMRNAEFERSAQHALGHLARLRRAIRVRQIHAAEADRGDFVRT